MDSGSTEMNKTNNLYLNYNEWSNERKFHKQLVETLGNNEMCPWDESQEGQRQGHTQTPTWEK